MNTGTKNTKGRTIFRGPRGGEYVLGPGGTKIRSFKVGEIAAAPPPPKPKSPPKNKHGRVIYRGAKGGLFVFTNAAKTKKSYVVHATNNNKARAKSIYTPPAAAPVAVLPLLSSPKLPTPSPRSHITTAERNRRLATIRAHLNALRAEYARKKPKARKNIEDRLRLAVRRARERRNTSRNLLQGWTTKNISIHFCHAPASVPRKPCTIRLVSLPVYEDGNSLIQNGTVVAMQEKDFDIDWFKRQSDYVSKLNDYNFWTVQAHTNRSHAWIGPYTYRGNVPTFRGLGGNVHITPLWPQLRKMILNGTYNDDKPWIKTFKNKTNDSDRYKLLTKHLMSIPSNIKKDALEMYKKDLKRIIAGAPKAKKKMILYRGSKFDIFKGSPGYWYKLKSFCSAAYDLNHAMVYGRIFTRITILPETPVLLVAGTNQWGYAGEYEVMVNLDTKYLIRSRDVLRHVYYNGKRFYIHDGYRVTDVTIAK